MAEKKRTRLRICELNPHLLCALCGGYLIDATTIVECLHSFCKTCILRYLETSNYCPICEVLIHKKRPWQNIRLDHTLQNAVYKLVPGLFKREMQRRRDFYEKNPPPVGKETEQVHVAPERIIFSEDEKFSVSLEFSPNGRAVQVASDKSVVMQPHHDKRFLLCPANVCIGHLKKFVRLKYTLPESYQIDLFYSDEPLEDTYTLMDVAYIYSWRRESVLTLYYSFYQCPRKRRRITASATATSQDRDTTSTANHIKAKTATSTSSSSANNSAPTTTTTSTVTIVEASEAGGVTETEGTKTTVSLSVPATSTTTTTSAAVSLPLPLPRASIGSLNSQSSSTLVDFDDDDDDDDDERPLIIVTDTPAASSTTTDTDLPESESGVTIINHPKTHGNKDGGRGCEANSSAGGGNDATDGFMAKPSATTAGLGLSLSVSQNAHAKDKTVISFISVGASSNPKPGALSSCGAIGSSSSVSPSCAAESPSLKKETIGCKEPSPHASSLQSKEQPFRLQSTATTPISKPDCTGTSPKKSCSKPSAEPAKSTSSSKSAPSTPAAEPTCLTPTSIVSCSKLSSEPKRSMASSESKRPTATSAPEPVVTQSEPKRSATSSESKPSSDPKPAAPPSQSVRPVLPSQPKRNTLSSETVRSAPPSQLARKTVPHKAKKDSSPVNQPSVNSKEQQRCNELAAQRVDASRPKEVARPKESQHLAGHSSGSKEPQNKKDIVGASKQSAPPKELLQPKKLSATTKPCQELPRQTESSRPTDSSRAKDTMRALESSSPARPKESARPLDSQRPNITSSKSSGNAGVSSKSVSGGASTGKSSTGGPDGSTKSPSGGGSIARHESNKKDARPVSSVKPSPPDASASQSGGKQPPSSSSSSSSTNYSNKPASEGLFERIYSVTSNSTSSGIKSIFKTTAIVPATSARRYSDVSGISPNASLGERRASVGGSSPSLKLSPGRDKISKSPGDPKQKASPSRDSRSSLDALSQLTKQSGLSSSTQGNKLPQPPSTHNKTGACSKGQAKDMTKPSGTVLCNASDKRHSSNVSGASVPTLASQRRPSSCAMPTSAKRSSGSYDPGGTTELDTGPTPEKRRSVDSAPTATVDRKNTPTAGNDSNTPTAPSDSKNTPTAPIDRKNTPTAPSDRKNTPTAPSDSKNTPTAPSDRKNTPTATSDRKNTPTAPSDRKNTPTAPSDSKNTPTAPSDRKNTPTATSDRKNTQSAANNNTETPLATCDSKNTSSATIDSKNTPTVVSDSKNVPTLAARAGRDVKVPVNISAGNDSKVTVTCDIKSLVTPSSADIKQNTKAPFAIITGDLRVKLPKCNISDQRLLSPSIPGKDKHGGSTCSSDTKAHIAGAALNLHSSPKVCGHEYIPNFLGVITTKPVYASVSSAVTAKGSDESKSKMQIGLMVKQSSINNNNGTTKPLTQSGVGATKKEEAPNSFSYKLAQGSVSNTVAQGGVSNTVAPGTVSNTVAQGGVSNTVAPGTVSNTVPVTNSSSSARKESTVKVNSTEGTKVKTVLTVNAAPPSQQASNKEGVGDTKTDVNAGVVEKAGVKGELGIAKNVDVKGNSGEHTAGVKPETKMKSAGAKSDATASSGCVQRDGSSGIAGVKRLHSSSNTAPSSSSGHSASTTSTSYSIVSSSAATILTSSKATTNHATKTPTSAASQLRIPCVGVSGGGGGGPDAKKARLSPASGVQFSMSPPITPTILSSSSSAGAQSPARAAAGGVTTPATVGLPASGKTTFSTNVSSAVGVNTKIRATGNQAMSGGKTLAPGQRVDSLLFRATNRLAAAAASAAAARPMTLSSLQVLPPGQKKVRSESVDSRMSFINKTFGGGKSSKETVVSPTAGRGEISFSARHILSSTFHSHVVPVGRGGSNSVSPSSASASGNKGGSAAGRGGSGEGPSPMAGRGNTTTSSVGRGRGSSSSSVAVAKPGTSPSAAKGKHICSSKEGNAAGACDLSKRSSSSGGKREGLSNGSSSSGSRTGKESGGGGGGMKLDIPRLSTGSSRDSVFASDPESSPTPSPKYSDINRNPIKLEPGSKLCRKDTWMTAENGGRRSTGSVGSPSSLGSGPGSPLESERSPARDARRPSDSELLMAQRWHGGLAHPHLLAIPHPRDPATAAAVAAALYNGHFKVPPSAKYLPLAHEHVPRPSSPEPMPLDYSTSSSSSK